MRPLKEKTVLADICAWTLICGYVLFFCYISFLRYRSFDFGDMDLGVYSQMIWNITQGSLYSSIMGVNILGHHAHFILFLIAPVYLLFQSPLTLLFLQTLSLGLAAYPIYLIAKRELNKKLALALLFSYLVYPALGYVNLYEFHVTVFATLFLSLMFYCFIKEDFRGFVLFMILSLLCQENMPLIIIPVGAYAFFAKRPKRWALVPVLSGLIWFWATVYKVMPYFNRDTIQFFRIYGHLGDSIPEIARSVLSNPIGAASGIMTRMDIFYLLSLSVPVCFLCLLDLRILIILPVLMQHLFSARLWEHTIFYHYTAEMLPVIFISTIYGIKRFFTVDFVKNNIRQGMFIGLFLTVAVTSSICFGGGLDLLANRKDITRDILDCQKERFIGMVPEDAGVVATFEFLPKLSRRKHLYSFHHIVDGAYTLSDRPYSLPENTEYALLDFNDSLTFDRFHPYFGCFIDFYDRGVSDANMRNFLKESDWGIIESAGSIVLLKKGHSSRHKLFQTLSRLPRISNHVGATAAGEVELIGYDVDRMDKQGAEQVKLTFFWKALNNDRGDYGCFLYIIGKDGCIISEIIKPICYRVYPSYAWREGEIVKEDYNLILPQEVKGGYIIRMGLFEYKDKDKRVLRFDSLSSDAVDDKGLVSIKI